MKTSQTLGIWSGFGGQLREVKRAAVIALFDRVRDLLQLRRRMIELARNLVLQFRMPRDRVIVNC